MFVHPNALQCSIFRSWVMRFQAQFAFENIIFIMISKPQQRRREEILNTIPIFLAKTFRIIDNPAYDDIISWSEDGRSFVVKNISRLTNEVFPRHFKHTNFLSFVRQLNMYGFRKLRGDEEGAIFTHEYFQKHDLEQLLLVKRKNAPGQQQADGTMVPASSREQKLQQEIAVLREQHEEIQGMMQILMEQNKAITAQNKAFASMMGAMKEKYRKKLETLMLLFLFGKKPKQEEGEFLFPPQFENMLEAFEQLKNGGNPLALVPQAPKRRRNLKMITDGPHFYSDIQRSENGSQMDHNEKEDIFKVLKEMSEGEEEQKDHQGVLVRRSSNRSGRDSPLNSSLDHGIPVSPISITSRGNKRRVRDCEWDQYLDRLNHSECSELELEQQHQ